MKRVNLGTAKNIRQAYEGKIFSVKKTINLKLAAFSSLVEIARRTPQEIDRLLYGLAPLKKLKKFIEDSLRPYARLDPQFKKETDTLISALRRQTNLSETSSLLCMPSLLSIKRLYLEKAGQVIVQQKQALIRFIIHYLEAQFHFIDTQNGLASLSRNQQSVARYQNQGMKVFFILLVIDATFASGIQNDKESCFEILMALNSCQSARLDICFIRREFVDIFFKNKSKQSGLTLYQQIDALFHDKNLSFARYLNTLFEFSQPFYDWLTDRYLWGKLQSNYSLEGFSYQLGSRLKGRVERHLQVEYGLQQKICFNETSSSILRSGELAYPFWEGSRSWGRKSQKEILSQFIDMLENYGYCRKEPIEMPLFLRALLIQQEKLLVKLENSQQKHYLESAFGSNLTEEALGFLVNQLITTVELDLPPEVKRFIFNQHSAFIEKVEAFLQDAIAQVNESRLQILLGLEKKTWFGGLIVKAYVPHSTLAFMLHAQYQEGCWQVIQENEVVKQVHKNLIMTLHASSSQTFLPFLERRKQSAQVSPKSYGVYQEI